MKRRATDELTPENWSSAADNEAADGGFEMASEEELAKRSFKKAKRRLGEGNSTTGSESDSPSPGTSGLFAGFKGFSSSSSMSMTSPGESKTFRASSSGSVSSLATTSVGLSSLGSPKPPLSSAPKSNTAPVSSLSGSLATENSLTQEEYEARLSALNTSFVNWIRKHHEKDPLADFTPTFDDYKKHLAKLDTQLQGASPSATAAVASSKPLSSKPLFAASPSTVATALTAGRSGVVTLNGSGGSGGSSLVGSVTNSPASDSSKFVKFAPISTGASSSAASSSSGAGAGTTSGGPAAGLFSFSAAPAAAASSSAEIGSSFKVGSSSLTFPTSILKSAPSSTSASGVLGLAPATNVSSGFFSGLVSSSTGGSSGGVPSFLLGKKDEKAGASAAAGGDGDEDADEEKDDMKPQEFDEDADILHKVRAKLFYKKGDGWCELGVGDFKVINMDGKTQLLMRNVTRLGTILLNVMLAKSTPCSRSGKNNVMLVSLPNPPLQKGKDEDAGKPVQYLIRVKSGDEADELHTKIAERKE